MSLDALRAAVRKRVGESSVRQVAQEIGVAHNTLLGFLAGKEPYGRTLAKLRAWHAEPPTPEVVRLRKEVAELKKRVRELERLLRDKGRPS